MMDECVKVILIVKFFYCFEILYIYNDNKMNYIEIKKIFFLKYNIRNEFLVY